jgi:AcrR family transcriptional regulator
MATDSWIGKRRRAALKASNADYVQRRSQLLETAAAVFAEKGVGRTSLREIAERLEIDRASLYYYVGSKSDLFETVAMGAARENVERIERIAASDVPPDEKLLQALTAVMKSYEERYPHLYVYINELTRDSGLATRTKRQMGELRKRHDKAFMDILKQGQASGVFSLSLPPNVLAYSVVGMLAWSHVWFHPGGPLTGKEIGDGLATLVLNGLRKRSSRDGNGRTNGGDRRSPTRS